MNQRFFLFIVISLLLLPLADAFSQKEVFLRKIDFELEKISPNSVENEYYMTLEFNKGSKYKFKVLNHINGKVGLATLELHDGDKIVGVNSMGDKYFDQMMFQCSKTGFYDLLIRFKDHQLGCSTINVYLVQ